MPSMSYRPPKHLHTPLSVYIESNQRFSEENIHGAFQPLVTGDTLSAGDDLEFVGGIGKFVIVVNAGTDMVGDVTVTGTSVNRVTGAESAADTATITLAGPTTDTSDTDAEGNARHALTDAYITPKWFSGAITISTTEVDLSDVDIWHCSFEQLNDQAFYQMETFDINAYATNANAWLYSYLYSVVPTTGNMVDITREASIELPDSKVAADRYYRLRRGAIEKAMDGSTDGFWVDLFFGPSNQTYWRDVTIKVWCHSTA